MRDECENHMAQELLKLANNLSKNYITVTMELVEGWCVPIPVITMKKIDKKIIPTLEKLEFRFNGGIGCKHPKFSRFIERCVSLNFVKVQYEDLHKIPAGYDIDKLEVKLAHPLFTKGQVANIIRHDIQKNPRWDADATITCKPFPKKEDVIKKITYSLCARPYALCRVEGCTSQNKGGPYKGFCTVHNNEHGEKFEETKPWGRILICKPIPKKEDVIKKITSCFIAGKYGPCRVEGCTTKNRGGPCKGFCSTHYNLHGVKYEETKPWGRIGEQVDSYTCPGYVRIGSLLPIWIILESIDTTIIKIKILILILYPSNFSTGDELVKARQELNTASEYVPKRDWDGLRTYLTDDAINMNNYEANAQALLESKRLDAESKKDIGTIRRYGVGADVIIMYGGLKNEINNEENDMPTSAGEVGKYIRNTSDSLDEVIAICKSNGF